MLLGSIASKADNDVSYKTLQLNNVQCTSVLNVD